MNNDLTVRNHSVVASKEIKASAHYAYIVNGITLDGSKFALNELVMEGQCLVKDTATGLYHKYTETTPGTFEPGKSNPVILDESLKFIPKDDGTNPNLTAGQVLVHGSVYKAMLTGVTQKFMDNAKGILFVE